MGERICSELNALRSKKNLIFLVPPLKPRTGGKLIVVGVTRISTRKQDEKSLADQAALYRSSKPAPIFPTS